MPENSKHLSGDQNDRHDDERKPTNRPGLHEQPGFGISPDEVGGGIAARCAPRCRRF